MPNEVPADSIDKRVLWRYVNKKIKRTIHHYHVFSVISILFDEILADLKQGKQIRIANFGILELKETKPRRHFDFKKQKIVMSRSYKILRFSLSEKIKKKLAKYLDLDATFKDD